MTQQQKYELGILLAQYTESIPECDADALMKTVVNIQRWIDRQIDNAVGRATYKEKKDDKQKNIFEP